MPKVSMPSMPASTSAPGDLDDVEPQEVRDQRARDAKAVFNDFDKTAKVRSCERCWWLWDAIGAWYLHPFDALGR
jgi:hypothetical protein